MEFEIGHGSDVSFPGLVGTFISINLPTQARGRYKAVNLKSEGLMPYRTSPLVDTNEVRIKANNTDELNLPTAREPGEMVITLPSGVTYTFQAEFMHEEPDPAESENMLTTVLVFNPLTIMERS